MTREPDFAPRAHLTNRKLQELFAWDEPTFLKNTEGSAIRRIGYERWQRNLAVGLGNSDGDEAVLSILTERLATSTALVAEHIVWAIEQQQAKLKGMA